MEIHCYLLVLFLNDCFLCYNNNNNNNNNKEKVV